MHLPTLAGLLVLAVLPGAAVAAPGGTDASSLDDIARVLTRRPEDGRSEKQVVDQLARLGPSAVEGLFDVYTGEGLEQLLGDGKTVWWCSYDRFGDLALRALGQLPAKRVLAHLESAAGPSAELDIRLAGIRVAGALGSGKGLPYLFGTAADVGPKTLRFHGVRRTLVESLAQVLATDGKAFKDLLALGGQLDPGVVELTIEAVALADRAEGTAFLVSVLGRSVELDVAAMDAASDLARRHAWETAHDPGPAIALRLVAEDPRIRRAAVVAVGRLNDLGSFSELVSLLEDSDPGVSRAAAWSLSRMSGQTALETREEWTAWFELEVQWWETQGARLRYALTHGDAKQVRAAANELMRHTLYRDELAAELGSMLSDLRPAVAGEVCALLSRLDSPVAIPYLVDYLFHAQGALAKAAWATLKRLTGEDLPLEPWVWKEYVGA